MDRDQAVRNVYKVSKEIQKPIPIMKFIRKKIVQEEVVEAYISPIPSAVQVTYQTIVEGRMVTKRNNRQVEKGNWVVIHKDGRQQTYTQEEFENIYEPMEEETSKKKETAHV